MKKKLIVALILFILFLIAIFLNISYAKKENVEAAEEIKSSLLGNVYEGKRRDYSSDKVSSGINMAEFIETEVVCEFTYSGTAIVITTESYCDGFTVVIDGEEVYDEVSKKEKEYDVGDVTISLGGNVQIKLGRENYSVIVDDNNNPTAIIVNNVLCELVG